MPLAWVGQKMNSLVRLTVTVCEQMRENRGPSGERACFRGLCIFKGSAFEEVGLQEAF